MGLFGGGLSFAEGSGKAPVICAFNTPGSACWCMCPDAKSIGIIVVGGGGGGGDGVETCTTGCATYYYPGGAGAGGGGISSGLYQACSISSPAAITIGAGGSRGTSATGRHGGDSLFVGGITLCGQGGRLGTAAVGYCNQTQTVAGSGGAGAVVGNCGGNGKALTNGNNAQTIDGAARGGGGGGGAKYCAVIPSSTTFTSAGSSSPVTSYDTGWYDLDLTNYGRGGRGGDASMDNARSVQGANGNSGVVVVVQYF